MERLFGASMQPCRISEEDKRELPHARVLSVEWADGASVQIRLDHGLGYWRTTWSKPFSFALPTRQQAAELRRARFGVEPSNDQCGTVVYVGEVLLQN